VSVLCREEDDALVSSVLDEAVQIYKEKSGVKELTATIDKTRRLPPGPESGKHDTWYALAHT
jgi:hypothetical protein